MTAPRPSPQEEADARDFAQFIAGQDPVAAAAASWLVRRQDGLTPAEQAGLEEWLAADPAHAKALQQVEGIWGQLDDLPDEDVDALKASLPEREAPRMAPPSQPLKPWRSAAPASPGRRSWLASLVPQAAMAAIAFGVIGGGWHGWNTWQQQPTFDRAYATARGQLQTASLPDGSTLWLDTSTRAHAALYRQRREVRLAEGQVLFAVQSNLAQPFDVLAGNTRITVVGTRFTVRRTRSGLGDEGSVSVAVEEGRVRVTSHAAQAVQPSQGQELGAGQTITIDAAGTLGPVSSNAAPANHWREGRVSFNDTPLAQALAEFERYGNTGLVIRDPAVAALRVHGSFDLRRIDAFASALPQVLPVRLQAAGDGKVLIAGR